jgi:hypothetical protein
MNRASRRRELRNQKQYTYADIKRAVKDTGLAVGRHNIGLTLSSVAIVLHRDHGFSAEECTDFLAAVGKEASKYMSYLEAQDAAKEQIGIEIASMFDEHDMI